MMMRGEGILSSPSFYTPCLFVLFLVLFLFCSCLLFVLLFVCLFVVCLFPHCSPHCSPIVLTPLFSSPLFPSHCSPHLFHPIVLPICSPHLFPIFLFTGANGFHQPLVARTASAAAGASLLVMAALFDVRSAMSAGCTEVMRWTRMSLVVPRTSTAIYGGLAAAMTRSTTAEVTGVAPFGFVATRITGGTDFTLFAGWAASAVTRSMTSHFILFVF